MHGIICMQLLFITRGLIHIYDVYHVAEEIMSVSKFTVHRQCNQGYRELLVNSIVKQLEDCIHAGRKPVN